MDTTGAFVRFEEAALDQSLATRFEQQVARHGDRTAVQVGRRAWTYDELNRAANRVARAILARRGRGAEPVCLLFPSGVEAIAALLGTLKAGKFYVPLDTALPHARLAEIVADAGAGVMLTDADHGRGIAGMPAIDVLVTDVLDSSIPDENLVDPAAPSDLACLQYTSGSTGGPKGVMQPHRSLLHWAMIQTNNLRVTPQDRLTMLHSWSMPSCLHHLLSSLLNGAALLPFDARTGDAGLLARWLREERVTVYHSIPAVFRQMAEALSGDERFPDLRAIVLSAAPTSPREVELFRRHFAAGAVLFNMMGTTETGWVRGGRIDASLDVTRAGVPVGYPVPDKEVLLLDEQGREVEPGNVGEIAVRSRYLASGYWRQPELTAARFSPGRDGAEQVYRTGDMGRMEADGCLFHLGRMDYQVKVRGFRVEIGEVERALLAHPVVEQAVAVGRPVAGADTRLVAYVVPAVGRTLTATELRRHMKDRLPDYMVPADFVPLASLPCTPNGKLDYAALPDPDRVRPELGTAYAAPATELERIIVPMWEELLQRDRVGVHDNFFDLGGDSLLLTLLQRRLLAELGEEMPLVQMFDHPTITAMVRYLRPSEDGSVPADKEGDRLDSMRVGRARLARLAGRRNAREVE